jgi:DNA-directed RNA polymerase specialized sigma24 family protein
MAMEKREHMDKLPEKKRKLNVCKAFKLRFQHGLSYREIGRQLGVRHGSVHKAVKRFEHFFGDPDAVQAYRNNRSTI